MGILILLSVMLWITMSVNGEVLLSDFFSFGVESGDSLLIANDDQFSEVKHIGIDFKFFYLTQRQLYVNTNGLISFVQGIHEYISEPFPKINDKVVLAPFWADIDTRFCNDSCQIWYRESTVYADIEKATTEVRTYFPVMKHFTATWTYIVTWFDVPYFQAQGEEFNKRNTFQAVLISDAVSSFVIFNYNKVQWVTSVQVGFNMGDEIHYYSVEGSKTPSMISLPSLSNVGTPGKFVFRVDLTEIEPAPTGGPGQCFFKAADVGLILDISASIDESLLKGLLNSVIQYIPINDYEFQIGMVSFSSTSKVEFDFNSHLDKQEIINHINGITSLKGTSNLKDALTSIRQLFSYGRGSRPYAKRFVIIFTDGLLTETAELILEADKLKVVATIITVGIGRSVKHDLLEHISTNNREVLPPSVSSIWTILQNELANPGCLQCKSQMQGEIYLLLEDSSNIAKTEFVEGKSFVYSLTEKLSSLNFQNIKVSSVVFGENIKHAIKLQDIAGIKYQLGRLAEIEYTGRNVLQSELINYLDYTVIGSPTNKKIFIFVTSGQFLDKDCIDKIKIATDNKNSILISIGIGRAANWDWLENLATTGYFVYSSDDVDLLVRNIPKELTTVSCI